MREIQVHPFDLTYDQIAKHRKQYVCPKGGLSGSLKTEKAALEAVFLNLSKKIHLHVDIWKNILKQFDQSTFDINYSQEDFESKFQKQNEQSLLKDLANTKTKGATSSLDQEQGLNMAQKQDIVLLSNKIEFSDFLRAIQRESVLRDILSQHQLYYHSIKRLKYLSETNLVNKGALAAIAAARRGGHQGKVKVPTVTYLIDHLCMFTFQGVQMLLIAFKETHQVQIFECSNGHFTHEFCFHDNVFTQVQSQNVPGEGRHDKTKDEQPGLDDKTGRRATMMTMKSEFTHGKEKKDKKVNPAEELEREFKKSGLSRAEFNYQRRKTLREKGEYCPEIPPYTKVKDVKNFNTKTLGRPVNSNSMRGGLDAPIDSRQSTDSMAGSLRKTATNADPAIKGFGRDFRAQAILEEENDDELLKNSYRAKDGVMNMNATIDWFSKSPNTKKQTQDFINSDFMKFEENRARGPAERFQARMDWNTLRSRQNAHNLTRDCCIPSEGNNYSTTRTRRSKNMNTDLQTRFRRNRTNDKQAATIRNSQSATNRLCGNNRLRSSTNRNRAPAESIEMDDFDQEAARLEGSVMEGSEAEHDTLTLGTQLNSQASNMIKTQSKGSLGLAMHMQSSKARRLKESELQREAEMKLEKIKEAPMRRNYRRHADAFGRLKVGVTGRVAATMDKQTREFAAESIERYLNQDKDQLAKIEAGYSQAQEQADRAREVFARPGKRPDARKTKPTGAVKVLRKPGLAGTRATAAEGGSPNGSGGSDDGSPGESGQRFGAAAAKAMRHQGSRAMSFKVSCEVNKKNMSREEYLSLKKAERLAQSAAARADIAAKRQNPKVSKMYGVLGLDPSGGPPEAGGDGVYEANSNINANPRNGTRAYGLGQKLFLTDAERLEAKETFKQWEQRAIQGEKKRLEYIALQKEQQIKDGTYKQSVYKPEVKKTNEEIQKEMNAIHLKENRLKMQIAELGAKQGILDQWLDDLSNCLVTQTRTDKHGKGSERQGDEIRMRGHKEGGCGENMLLDGPLVRAAGNDESQPPPAHLVKIREQRLKQREERKAKFDKVQETELETSKGKNKQQTKKTYPMCMEYYEPHNIAIFALVSKEIQIHQLKQTGVRRTFFHIQSLRVEHMIVAMSVEEHKGSGNLLLCLGTQSKNVKKSEVVAYVLDPRLEFEVIQSYRWIWPEEQMTSVYYKAGCGLILASFTGYLEIFDPININHSIWDNSRSMKKESSGSISTVAYSEALDIIAYAGVSGKIFIIDQTTKNPNGQIQAHKYEISMLSFYDAQHQLISVSQTGEVGLWDAQKLTKIQLLRNSVNMTQKIISACQFYMPMGRVLMATTKIFNYDLYVDADVKIHTEQQNAVARDYLRSFLAHLQHAGIVTVPAVAESKAIMDSRPPSSKDESHSKLGMMSQGSKKTLLPKGKQGSTSSARYQNLSEQEYLQTAYIDSSIKDAIPSGKEFNGSVLASMNSTLIGLIIDSIEYVVYTIDSDLMIRVWDLSSSRCIRSYLIETRDDQIAEANQSGGAEAPNKPGKERKKATVARSDSENKFLVVAFEGGEIQANNLFTGALIYNNAAVPPIQIDTEIAQMKFFNSQTKFWIAASCWEGKVAFISRPQESQGLNFLVSKKCKCSHQSDVLTLDINHENQLVTGSTDNVICIWNSFNGEESKKILVPADIAPAQRGRSIQYLRFPFKNKKEILLVVISDGACYILETQTERWFEFHHDDQQDIDERRSPNVDEHRSRRSNAEEDRLTAGSGPGSPGLRPGGQSSGLKMRSPGSPSRSSDDGEAQSDLDGEDNGPITRSPSTALKAKEPARSSKIQNKEPKAQRSMKGHSKTRDPRRLGTIAADAAIDLQDSYLASVSEDGRGVLNRIIYNQSQSKAAGAKLGRQRAQDSADVAISASNNRAGSDSSKIIFEEVASFTVNSGGASRAEHGDACFQIDICIDHGIFIVAQQRGQVSILSLASCEVLGILNKGVVHIPAELERPKIAANQRLQQLENAEHRRKRLHFSKCNAVPAKWNKQLRNSRIKNSERFSSDVLQSLWKVANHPNATTGGLQNCQSQPAGAPGDRTSRVNLLSDDSQAFQPQNAASGVPHHRNGSGQFQTLPQQAPGAINFYGRDNPMQSSIQVVENSHRVGDEGDLGKSKAQSRTILSGSTQTGTTQRR